MKQRNKKYCLVLIISKPLHEEIKAKYLGNRNIYHDEVIIDELHSFPIICEQIVMPITGLEYFYDVVTGKIYRGKRKKDGPTYIFSNEIILEKAEKISAETVCSFLKGLTAEKITSYTETMEKIESKTLEFYQEERKKYKNKIKYIKGFNQGKKRVLSRIKENLKR